MTDINATLTAYANPIRRFAMYYLYTTDQPQTTRNIAEAAKTALDLERTPRKIALSLRHSHLPHLEKNGFIQWDESENTAAIHSCTDFSENLLEELATVETWNVPS